MKAIALPALLTALLVPSGTAAQALLIQVQESGSNAPLAGALVYLETASGFERSTLSNERGEALFAGVAPGDYSARVEMIGRASVTTGVLRLTPGSSVRHVVSLTASPISISGLDVGVDERCRTELREGELTHALWEEARKALDAVAITEQREWYSYRTMTFERDVDRQARVVQREDLTEREGPMLQPFASRPVSVLMRDGFVEHRAEGDLYFAPDAQVMLADEFLDRHCFAVRGQQAASDTVIGLFFEPLTEQGVVDIAGALWLDVETAELRSLEFRYTGLDQDINTSEVGGEVVFRALPSGERIVDEWLIRTPTVELRRGLDGTLRPSVIGFRESGGHVLEVRRAGGRALARGTATGSIEGIVLDSLGLPVRGARVREVGSTQEVFTDANGRFGLVRLTPGVRRLAVTNDQFAWVNEPPVMMSVEVERGRVTVTEARLPSITAVLGARCADRVVDPEFVRDWDAIGSLFGRVIEETRALAVRDLRVRVSWANYDLRARGARIDVFENGVARLFSPVETGRYQFCTLPVNRSLALSVLDGDEDLTAEQVRIPLGRQLLVHDIRIGQHY